MTLVNPARTRYADRLTTRLPVPAPGEWTRIAPQTGTAFTLGPGDRLYVLDPMGEQVSDLYLVDAADVRHQFSSGRTTDYGNSIYVSVGSLLYSNRSVPLARVVEDSVGVHDLTLTPCSQDTFDLLYPEFEGAPHPSCFANTAGALTAYGVDPDSIGVTLNVFMDVWTDARGELHIDPPPTRPGDVFAIEALMPLVVSITACSAEKSNNGHCTPIDYRVSRA